jgi:SAM-dependent methyltransferase
MSKTIQKTLSRIQDLYSNNLSEHGLTSKSVGWKDPEGQILRFDKLLELITDEDKRRAISVLDYGCGYGAMYEYMVKSGFQINKFYGYDISNVMLEEAKSRIPVNIWEPRNDSKIQDQADYSFVSGTFNVMFETSKEEWDLFIKEKVKELYNASNKGVAFNVLSSYVDWKANDLYYADPLYYFDYFKRNLSSYVTLLHDYPLYEWTLLIRKPQ